MDKSKRQQQLLEIVTKIEVNTQEELIKILEAQGLKVTQAVADELSALLGPTEMQPAQHSLFPL